MEQTIKLNSQTNFPWLLSNLQKLDGTRLVGTKETHVIEKHGLRFGFMGLADISWITTIRFFDLSEVFYEDFIECAKRLSATLRVTHKCDFVIALTHLRNHNDQLLASSQTGIDFVLGGHDHVVSFHPDLPPPEVS